MIMIYCIFDQMFTFIHLSDGRLTNEALVGNNYWIEKWRLNLPSFNVSEVNARIILNGELKFHMRTFRSLLRLCDWQSSFESVPQTWMRSRSLSLAAPRGSCAVLLHIMNTISHHRGQLETWQPPAGTPSQRDGEICEWITNFTTNVSRLWFDSAVQVAFELFCPGLYLSLQKPNCWPQTALRSEIKTTTWQKQVQLSFLLHWSSLRWFTDFIIHNWQWHKWYKTHHTDFVTSWPVYVMSSACGGRVWDTLLEGHACLANDVEQLQILAGNSSMAKINGLTGIQREHTHTHALMHTVVCLSCAVMKSHGGGQIKMTCSEVKLLWAALKPSVQRQQHTHTRGQNCVFKHETPQMGEESEFISMRWEIKSKAMLRYTF